MILLCKLRERDIVGGTVPKNMAVVEERLEQRSEGEHQGGGNLLVLAAGGASCMRIHV